MSKYEADHIKIKELLADRLNKLGPVKLSEAYQICRSEYIYGTLQAHFRCIMQEMLRDGRADYIRSGLWFIHKQTKTPCPKP